MSMPYIMMYLLNYGLLLNVMNISKGRSKLSVVTTAEAFLLLEPQESLCFEGIFRFVCFLWFRGSKWVPHTWITISIYPLVTFYIQGFDALLQTHELSLSKIISWFLWKCCSFQISKCIWCLRLWFSACVLCMCGLFLGIGSYQRLNNKQVVWKESPSFDPSVWCSSVSKNGMTWRSIFETPMPSAIVA